MELLLLTLSLTAEWKLKAKCVALKDSEVEDALSDELQALLVRFPGGCDEVLVYMQAKETSG